MTHRVDWRAVTEGYRQKVGTERTKPRTNVLWNAKKKVTLGAILTGEDAAKPSRSLCSFVKLYERWMGRITYIVGERNANNLAEGEGRRRDVAAEAQGRVKLIVALLMRKVLCLEFSRQRSTNCCWLGWVKLPESISQDYDRLKYAGKIIRMVGGLKLILFYLVLLIQFCFIFLRSCV